MKVLGLLLVFSVFVSCGKDSSKAKESRVLDPVTLEKFDKHLQSLRPGMVTVQTTQGQDYDVNSRDNGTLDIRVIPETLREKETILNISGDTMYTLVEEFEDGDAPTFRQVIKESLSQLSRENAEPLPEGFSIRVSGNNLSVSGVYGYMMSFPEATFGAEGRIEMSLNLDDIRCSPRQNVHITNVRLLQDDVTTLFPDLRSEARTHCERTLSQTDLRGIDLRRITLCDETIDSDHNCEYGQDLQHLVW